MIENVLLDEQDLSRVKDVPFTVVSLEENQFERVRTPLEGYFEAAEAIFVRVSHSGQIMYCVYGRLNLETPMIQIEQANRTGRFIITVQNGVTMAKLHHAAAVNQAVQGLSAYVKRPTLLTDVVPPTLITQQRKITEYFKELFNVIQSTYPEKAINTLNEICEEALRARIMPDLFFRQYRETVMEALASRNLTDDQIHPLILRLDKVGTVSAANEVLLDTVTLIKQSSSDLSSKDDLIAQLNQIINQRYAQNSLSLKWISNHLLFLNAEYLGKKYFQFTGKKFSQVLAETRMKQAAEMLKQNYQINEVASRVGFENNPDYFGQQFKKLYGITPHQFKKRNVPLS